MIVVYHQKNKVIAVEDQGTSLVFKESNVVKTLLDLAKKNSTRLIVWCDFDFKSNLNTAKFQDVFHHHKIMASYNTYQDSFLSESIGYVEESLFVTINKKVKYPTWQMSSCVGGIYSDVLLSVKEQVKETKSFDYFLHSIAKLAMPNGLLCYSEPDLLKDLSISSLKIKKNNYRLFRFVRQHYKIQWLFLLFLNLFLYERKIAFLPFIFSFFYSKRKVTDDLLKDVEIHSAKKIVDCKTIDVIIPTIGRKFFLYDVLKDLSKQTHLPENVVIVEQNPNPKSLSELDYLVNESWPFVIKHIFTHNAGACNARNLALAEINSEWIFMADDDIRLNNDFIENIWGIFQQTGCEQITLGCYGVGYSEQKKEKKSMQWASFGSGCSVVKAKNIKNIIFDIRYEFGYGEDGDFGMQMRSAGHDVIYFPKPEILHLQAPIGGFRTKPILAWHQEIVQPKPSPTVMLYKLKYLSPQQLASYKTVLLIKFYFNQAIKHPIKYYKNFQNEWEQSLVWANILKIS